VTWGLPQAAQCSEGRRECQGRGDLQLDPFEREIGGRTIYRYLCEHCAQELADDI
jgi:hypothetical protein